MDDYRTYPVSTLAEMSGCSVDFLRKQIKSRQLVRFYTGTGTRVLGRDYKEWCDKRREQRGIHAEAFYSVKDIAGILQVSTHYVRGSIAAGELPYLQFSRNLVRLRGSDVLAWIETKAKWRKTVVENAKEAEERRQREYWFRKMRSARARAWTIQQKKLGLK
jgi:excisionase family DNA binding protein